MREDMAHIPDDEKQHIDKVTKDANLDADRV